MFTEPVFFFSCISYLIVAPWQPLKGINRPFSNEKIIQIISPMLHRQEMLEPEFASWPIRSWCHGQLQQEQLLAENDIEPVAGQQLHLAMFGDVCDGYASLPSGNEWTFAITDRNRTKQSRRSSHDKDCAKKNRRQSRGHEGHRGCSALSTWSQGGWPECEWAEMT